MLSPKLLALATLPLLASAHFFVQYPTSRNGDDEEGEETGPCGGKPISKNRTVVSFPSFPVALEMGHDRSVVQMLLALGNNPGDNFNIVLEQTFQQQGEGNFCLPQVTIPSSVNVTDGSNATLQVITDGEDGGGLYICADITFTSMSMPLPSSCTNGTGITAAPLANPINANESNADGSPQNGDSASPSATGSPTASAGGSESSSTDNEGMMLTAGWGMLGAAVMGAVALM